MTSLQFHILDIIARDEIIEHEDEETREVSYADDNDYGAGAGAATAAKPRTLKITLFGKTAAGTTVRECRRLPALLLRPPT
jgi:hypothetical protein